MTYSYISTDTRLFFWFPRGYWHLTDSHNSTETGCQEIMLVLMQCLPTILHLCAPHQFSKDVYIRMSYFISLFWGE